MLTAKEWLRPFGLASVGRARYNYHHGPCVENLPYLRGELRINCQLLTSIILQEVFAISLPGEARSYEIWTGQIKQEPQLKVVTQPVTLENARPGDIFLFAQDEYTGNTDVEYFEYHCQLHLAVCVQIAQELNQIALIHASRWTKTDKATRARKAVRIWTLQDFLESTHYSILKGIRRVM